MEASGNIDNLTDTELLKVEELIHGMHYGSITIIVQDGRVVQIDKTEKFRIKN